MSAARKKPAAPPGAAPSPPHSWSSLLANYKGGAHHPYISVVDLRDLLNAAGGKWTTAILRQTLGKAGALTPLPESKGADSIVSKSRQRRSARRQFYTSAALLLAKMEKPKPRGVPMPAALSPSPKRLLHPAEISCWAFIGEDEAASDKGLEAVQEAYRLFALFLGAHADAAVKNKGAAAILRRLQESVEESRRR